MSAEARPRAAAGSAMAAWSAKALLITAGVFLVGGSIWYARAATVPLIVAALISTQLLPLIEMATARGMARWLAVVLSMLLVVAVGIGLAWVFTDTLFGNLGGVGQDISEGADKVVNWLRDNDDWAKQHEQQIRDFLASILPAAKNAAGGHRQGRARRTLLHGADRERRAPGARVPALHHHQRRLDLGMDPGPLQQRAPRARRRWRQRGVERRERLHPRHQPDRSDRHHGDHGRHARHRHPPRRHARPAQLRDAVRADPRRVGVGDRDRARDPGRRWERAAQSRWRW